MVLPCTPSGPNAEISLERIPSQLRGSFAVSGPGGTGYYGLFDFFMAQERECETITLGYNPPSSGRTYPKLNDLFAKCKDLLKTPSLTTKFPPLGDLSPCPPHQINLKKPKHLVALHLWISHLVRTCSISGYNSSPPSLGKSRKPSERSPPHPPREPLDKELTRIGEKGDQDGCG